MRTVVPVADAGEPLWLALRAALDERGYSVRGFAKLCSEESPNASWDSWKRTVNRALDPDAAKPYTPSRETAELWARLLRKPKGYFVRQQERVTIREERDQLRERVRELERELARHRQPGRSRREPR